jgi:hypothetical protein
MWRYMKTLKWNQCHFRRAVTQKGKRDDADLVAGTAFLPFQTDERACFETAAPSDIAEVESAQFMLGDKYR